MFENFVFSVTCLSISSVSGYGIVIAFRYWYLKLMSKYFINIITCDRWAAVDWCWRQRPREAVPWHCRHTTGQTGSSSDQEVSPSTVQPMVWWRMPDRETFVAVTWPHCTLFRVFVRYHASGHTGVACWTPTLSQLHRTSVRHFGRIMLMPTKCIISICGGPSTSCSAEDVIRQLTLTCPSSIASLMPKLPMFVHALLVLQRYSSLHLLVVSYVCSHLWHRMT